MYFLCSLYLEMNKSSAISNAFKLKNIFRQLFLGQKEIDLKRVQQRYCQIKTMLKL